MPTLVTHLQDMRDAMHFKLVLELLGVLARQTKPRPNATNLKVILFDEHSRGVHGSVYLGSKGFSQHRANTEERNSLYILWYADVDVEVELNVDDVRNSFS